MNKISLLIDRYIAPGIRSGYMAWGGPGKEMNSFQRPAINSGHLPTSGAPNAGEHSEFRLVNVAWMNAAGTARRPKSLFGTYVVSKGVITRY